MLNKCIAYSAIFILLRIANAIGVSIPDNCRISFDRPKTTALRFICTPVTCADNRKIGKNTGKKTLKNCIWCMSSCNSVR